MKTLERIDTEHFRLTRGAGGYRFGGRTEAGRKLLLLRGMSGERRTLPLSGDDVWRLLKDLERKAPRLAEML